MKILLSGASSFTGFWFARELRRQGHQVTCLFRAPSVDQYGGVRGRRVRQLRDQGEALFGLIFGSPEFLDLVQNRSWDLYAHHAAEVANYKSPDFDYLKVLQSNTLNLRPVLEHLKGQGCSKLVLTGSIFEGGEGVGSDGLPHISPYGLSKTLTSEVFAFESRRAQVSLGKFVIPNPFGPYEEPRFVHHLMSCWHQGQAATVATPGYVRDNIPVDLLARDYAHFLETLPEEPGFYHCTPSGMVGEQGFFAQVIAQEMRSRLEWPCLVNFAQQSEFLEPRVRINTDSAQVRHPDWNESEFWDRLAEYYLDLLE